MPQHGAGEEAERGMAGLRILVVDDMEEMLQAFKSLLEQDGATVFGATRACEALAILEREEVDRLCLVHVDGFYICMAPPAVRFDKRLIRRRFPLLA